MKIIQLNEIINSISNTELNFIYDLTKYNDSNEPISTVETLDGSLIKSLLIKKHFSKSFVVYFDNDIKSAFLDYWNTFCSINRYFISRRISAIMSEFNPLNNYDKKSTITDTFGKDKTTNTSGSRSDTIVLGEGKTTNTEGAQKIVSENKVSPEDSLDYDSPTDKTTSNRDSVTNTIVTDSVTNTNTKGQEVDTSERDSRIDTRTEKTFGNIGVMTSTQAINEILTTYNFNIYDLVVDSFSNDYLLYL